MRKRTNIIIGLYLAVLLVAPLALWGFGQRSANIENRTLTEFPERSAAAFADEDFYRQVSDYFGDRLPLRERAITVDAWVDYRVAGDSPVDEVIVGDDGWLFLAEAFEEACNDSVDPQVVAATLDRMVDIIGASGRRAIVYTAPNKASVYPEHATSIAKLECTVATRDATRSAITGRSIPGFIDSWEHLEEIRSTSAEPVYNPLDTHWNPAFDDDVAKLLLDAIDPALWDSSAVGEMRTERVPGELAALMGLPQSHQVPVQDVQRADTVSVRIDDNDRFGPNTYTTTSGLPLAPNPVFMVHDSFGNGLEPILVQYLAQSTYLHWRNVVNAPAHGGTIYAQHVEAADVVIIESVERLLYRRFGSQLLDYPAALTAVMLDDLPHVDLPTDVLAAGDLSGIPLEYADGRPLYLVVEFDGSRGQRIRTSVDGERDDRWVPLEGPLRVGWDVSGASEIEFDESLPPIASVYVVWVAP